MTTNVVLKPDKVIRCRFDLNHEVFPGGFYDVRWFRADDRGKLIEITRERFRLRNHPVGRRTESASRTNRKLAPKALPTSEHEIKPRRAVEAVETAEQSRNPAMSIEHHRNQDTRTAWQYCVLGLAFGLSSRKGEAESEASCFNSSRDLAGRCAALRRTIQV